MKHLSPTSGGALRRTQIEALVTLHRLLLACNGDLDHWCEQLGFFLEREEPDPLMPACITGGVIYIPSGLTYDQEKELITHEYCHFTFHAATAAYRSLDVFTINRSEREANLFAEEFLKL